MRVRVDEELCQASGYCERIAPQAFVLTAEVAEVLIGDPTDAELIEQVQEAESSCPARAILLDD